MLCLAESFSLWHAKTYLVQSANISSIQTNASVQMRPASRQVQTQDMPQRPQQLQLVLRAQEWRLAAESRPPRPALRRQHR